MVTLYDFKDMNLGVTGVCSKKSGSYDIHKCMGHLFCGLVSQCYEMMRMIATEDTLDTPAPSKSSVWSGLHCGAGLSQPS